MTLLRKLFAHGIKYRPLIFLNCIAHLEHLAVVNLLR
jgi:hypothetical protein